MIPLRHLVGYQIRNTSTVVFDLNVICTLVNYVAQNTILVLKIQRSIEDYHSSLDWITFAAAMIALIGAVSSLHKCKNRTHKGIWFNVLVSLLLVVASGHALAVHSDPKVWANVLSILLLYVTKTNSKYKESYYLLGEKMVPIAGFCVQGDGITAVAVSAEHAHLVNSRYQDDRNLKLLVSSGEGLMANINMREECPAPPVFIPITSLAY